MNAQANRARWGAVAIAVGLAALVVPASAGAATQVGLTFPGPALSCTGDLTKLAAVAPNNEYAAPTGGVLTSWSFHAGPITAPLALKVARPNGGNSFTVVGESPLRTPTANVLNTYFVRIPVAAGDVIGEYNGAGSLDNCARSVPGYFWHYRVGDQQFGSVETYSSEGPVQMNLSATLEPDCDGDGLGDETQDSFVDLGVCDRSVPETTITARPKDKTKQRKAKFEFTSSEEFSTFQCSFDGEPFTACTSPTSKRVGKGRHTFQVRAVDPRGNTDVSEAVDDWVVKKKKRRR